MKNFERASYFTRLQQALQRYARASLFKAEVEQVLGALSLPFADLDRLMEIAHQGERLQAIFVAGLENNAAFKKELLRLAPPSWKDYREPPASAALQENLATMLYYRQPVTPADKPVFRFDEKARTVGRMLVEKAMQEGIDFEIEFENASNFKRLVLNSVAPENIAAIAAKHMALFDGVNKRISCLVETPSQTLIEVNAQASAKLAELTRLLSERVTSGQMDYCVTFIPTEQDAAIDGFEYNEYVKLFFELCDQPWAHIDRAQRHLIPQLDRAHVLRLTSVEGTDISMVLDDEHGRPMTFCNSLTARNVPGSEVFSAPRRDSVNGVIVAKGRFQFTTGKIITDLTLHFKDGKLERFEAADGGHFFQAFLDRDPGNYYTGEIGIGTNPHLKRHVLNGLLVEKIARSFHMALGKCYDYTTYMGEPVHVDNGNTSRDHWDITSMLGPEGRIELDGVAVMDKGRFLDPELAVLNDGWAAVPVEDRPEYWKGFKGYGA